MRATCTAYLLLHDFKTRVMSVKSTSPYLKPIIEKWKKLLWPNLRYYPGIYLEGRRKTTTTLGQDTIILDKPILAQLVKLFPTFHEI
jgi:hypothetical protein